VIGLAVSYAIVQVVFSAFAPLSVTVGEGGTAEYLRWASGPVTARWTLSGLVTGSDLCRPVAEEGTDDEDDEEDGDDEEDADRDEERDVDVLEERDDAPVTVLQPDQESASDAGVAGSDGPLLPPPGSVAAPSAPGAPTTAPAVPEWMRCDPDPGCDDDVCLRDDIFMERCEKKFYLDHGLPEADRSADRTDFGHLLSSVSVNAILALVALLGAGLFLRRKSH
jgi:hypothetical protein